jgi:hypothetical protein
MNFKTITHVFAVILAGLAAFAVSPAGQAVVHQYPKLSGVVAAIVALSALYHSPKAATAVLLLLLMPALALAQTPPATPTPLFSVSTQAVALRIGGQTVAGTDAIGSFNLTPNLQIQSDNILAPANNYQGYFGGVKYYAPFLAKPLAKTSLSSVKPYFHSALGVVRNVPATGSASQHYGGLAGAGFDYQVNGTFSFGPRVEYMNSPGFGPSPHGVAVSANLTIVLGSH